MRYWPLLLLLASCQTWGWSDTADALMPDALTIGEGDYSGLVEGGYVGHSGSYEYEEEGASTYAALTWDLPSIKSDNGMSRETQRNLALLVDHMVAEEGIEAPVEDGEGEPAAATGGPLKMNLREGASLPSKEILYGVLGALLLVALLVRYKASASRRRWQ